MPGFAGSRLALGRTLSPAGQRHNVEEECCRFAGPVPRPGKCPESDEVDDLDGWAARQRPGSRAGGRDWVPAPSTPPAASLRHASPGNGGARKRPPESVRNGRRVLPQAPGAGRLACFRAFRKRPDVSEEPRGPRPSRSREGGGFPPSGPRGPKAVPAARLAGEPPGRHALRPALRLTRAHTFPDDHFAPTVGFAGSRPSAIPAAANWPGSRLGILVCSIYVPVCQALTGPGGAKRPPFRETDDRGMPGRCGRGGTGRRRRLKISCPTGRAGSSPAVRTITRALPQKAGLGALTARFRSRCRYPDQ